LITIHCRRLSGSILNKASLKRFYLDDPLK
jgi:hypothetical protein